MMRRTCFALMAALSLYACSHSQIGPFVRDIEVQEGRLLVTKCYIEKAGDSIAEGECSQSVLLLPMEGERYGPL
jgi:hypothetical protein